MPQRRPGPARNAEPEPEDACVCPPTAASDDATAAHGGAYADYAVAVASGAAATPTDLRPEIAVVRRVLTEVLRSGTPPDKLAPAVARLVQVLVQVFREHRQASGTAGDAVEQGTIAALEEMGMGE